MIRDLLEQKHSDNAVTMQQKARHQEAANYRKEDHYENFCSQSTQRYYL